MANQWFKFKNFIICQDKCAMKVGTDGVILGAWADMNGATKVLDIGTGTGLLALMIAQRSQVSKIDALEIDKIAAEQALQNIMGSNFAGQIDVINIDFRNYYPGCNKTYDLIICNPPYFDKSKKPIDNSRVLARHTESLSLENILEGAKHILSQRGRLSLILPAGHYVDLCKMALLFNLFPSRILHVIPTPGKPAKRICLELKFNRGECVSDSIIIEENGRHSYSDAYKHLTQDFYLED